MNFNNQELKKIKFNSESLLLLPLAFIKKYNCITYGIYDNQMLMLINEKFSYYSINRIKYFIDKDIKFIFVTNEEWEYVTQLATLESEKNNAIYKFNLKKDETITQVVNENNDIFYNAEIKNSPIVKIVDSIIGEAITLNCSDIHFEPMIDQIRVRVRLDGKLIEKTILPISSLNEVISRIKVLANLDITKKLIPQDGKLNYILNNTEYDIRVSIIPSVYGERVALRILDVKKGLYQISDLGFNEKTLENINKLINSSSGLVLVVGPTGSGKSTTLQTFLLENSKKDENIITVEDPVEYSIPKITQVQVNEESGLTFALCLKTILRQDPNIIMIGEIRDLETAKIACRASITGHLVYSTLHTNTSLGVVNRLKDMEIENYLLTDSLKGIISQRLVRCLCNNCKKKKKVTKAEAKYLGIEEGISLYKPTGCGACNMTGYSGRRGIYEVIIIDDDIKKLISENSLNAKFIKLLEKKGIQTLFENGKELVLQGITSTEELQSVLN